MQSTPLPPNPHLRAILLVIQSRTGPRFVFHYPARPSIYQDSTKRQSSQYTAHGTNTTPSDDSEASSSDDSASNSDTDGDDCAGIISRISGGRRYDVTAGGSATGRRSRAARGSIVDQEDERLSDSSDGDGIQTKSGRDDSEALYRGVAEWEKVLGYSTDGLQKLLCPPRTFHKKRFEVCLDGLVFLGCPMFVREDGLWRRNKRPKRLSEQFDGKGSTNVRSGVDGEALHEAKVPVQDGDAEKRLHAEISQQSPTSTAKKIISEVATNPTKGSKLTMFHVVFVMNPPALEYHIRLDDMYRNVAREFAKILKIEQAQSLYVWSQSKQILGLKQRGIDNGIPISTLWNEIRLHSSLAECIANVYNAISNSKIAHLKLSSPVEIPLQIPQPASTFQVSTPTNPQLPGLWLTTTNVLDPDSHGMISPYMGILLLQDAETVLKDLAREEQELSAALIYFVRNLIPTKSLLKLSKIMKLSLQELQYLSDHLISGRRARTVPPLHPRDTYIVSPNADMRQLGAATDAFAQRFPTFPSLPKMLTMLSGAPKAYGMLMPSKDHRPAYVDILAWLMRGGWVTQLRTFAWVRLAPHIQHRAYLKILGTQAERAAAAAREAEEDASKVKANQLRQTSSEHLISRFGTRGSSNSSQRPIDDVGYSERSPRSIPLPTSPPDNLSPVQTPVSAVPGSASEIAPAPDLLSPILSALRPPSRPASATGSVSSIRTAVHNPNNVEQLSANAAPRSPLLSTQSPSFTPSPSVSPYPPTDPQHYLSSWPIPSVSDLAPLVAYDTHNAATKQFFDAALALLGEELGNNDDEMRRLWPRFVKYFNGKWALEEISVREGLKRARVQAMVGKLREEGHLCIVRHW